MMSSPLVVNFPLATSRQMMPRTSCKHHKFTVNHMWNRIPRHSQQVDTGQTIGWKIVKEWVQSIREAWPSYLHCYLARCWMLRMQLDVCSTPSVKLKAKILIVVEIVAVVLMPLQLVVVAAVPHHHSRQAHHHHHPQNHSWTCNPSYIRQDPPLPHCHSCHWHFHTAWVWPTPPNCVFGLYAARTINFVMVNKDRFECAPNLFISISTEPPSSLRFRFLILQNPLVNHYEKIKKY